MDSKKEITSELIKQKKINVEGKHEGHFFENVLTDIVEKTYLKPEDMQRIQVELVSLWREQIEAYNKGKSSSITEKKAKSLLESIYHTLGFKLRSLKDLDESIQLLQYGKIKDLFKEGQSLIRDRFKILKMQYEDLHAHLMETDNIAYRDTYDVGLAPFFKYYDWEFESQECPCSIDYPLSNDPMELVGIEYMISYIEKSLLEHALCLKFKPQEIKVLLEGYHLGYREININIFELVLMNLVGRLMVGKEINQLELEEEDVEAIEKQLEILPTPLLEKGLKDKAMEVLERLDLISLEMKVYAMQTVSKYVPRVELVIEEEALDTVFIIDQHKKANRIEYQGGKRLDHQTFKQLTEEIRDCKDVQGKIKWIKEKVEHVEDLKDILEADCIFDEEYLEIYKSLEDVEIALLLNLLRVDENDCLEMELEEEWFCYLKQYIQELSKERQQAIKTVEHYILQ